MKKGPIDKDAAKDIAALNDILESRGICWMLTKLADAVRAQGKRWQKERASTTTPTRNFIYLSESVAKAIERARDEP